MSRLTLLLPLLVYLTFDPRHARHPVGLDQLLLSVAALLAMPLLGLLYAKWCIARSHPRTLHVTAVRVNRVLGGLRLAALLWTAPAMYVFGWAEWLGGWTFTPHPSAVGALVMTLPAYVGWLLLYAAQYPAERAIREQAMLAHLDEALPVHAPPPLIRFLGHQLRTGLGVFVAPVLAVLAVRDGLVLTLDGVGWTGSAFAQSLLFVVASAVVFALFPVALVRLLRTRPLPDGPLRRRLERLAARSGVRIRDILLWETGYSTCNAMVTGLLPGLRYVLLSDLLVESLTDRDVEAVFAHELGHIVHRHVAWYGAFLVGCAVLLGGVDVLLGGSETAGTAGALGGGEAARSLPVDAAVAMAALAATVLGFGYLSRRFENQADAYAARAVGGHTDADELLAAFPPLGAVHAVSENVAVAELLQPVELADDTAHPLDRPVTPDGSAAFIRALSRVAWLNNIAPHARNFTHGSIASRMARLSKLAATPQATDAFDRHMTRIRYLLAALLVAAAGLGAAVLWQGG
ncbi:MAG: M48 family metallopeptidase [Tepidisphaerales bacterium]